MPPLRVVLHSVGVYSEGKYTPLEIGFFSLCSGESGSILVDFRYHMQSIEADPKIKLVRKRAIKETEGVIRGSIGLDHMKAFLNYSFKDFEIFVLGQTQKELFEKYFDDVKDLRTHGVPPLQVLFDRRHLYRSTEDNWKFSHLSARAKSWLIGQCAKRHFGL